MFAKHFKTQEEGGEIDRSELGSTSRRVRLRWLLRIWTFCVSLLMLVYSLEESECMSALAGACILICGRCLPNYSDVFRAEFVF